MATAKQIAARKLFAERARAGTLKRGAKRKTNPVKSTRKKITEFQYNGFDCIVTRMDKDDPDYGENKFRTEIYGYQKYWLSPTFEGAKSMAEIVINSLPPDSKHRKPNPDKSRPRAYVARASQITGASPSKRLKTRRKAALTAPAGYFPNPGESELSRSSKKRPLFRVEVTHRNSPDYFFLTESGAVAEAKKLVQLDGVGNVYSNTKRGTFKWTLIYWFDSTGVYPAGSYGQANTRVNPIKTITSKYKMHLKSGASWIVSNYSTKRAAVEACDSNCDAGYKCYVTDKSGKVVHDPNGNAGVKTNPISKVKNKQSTMHFAPDTVAAWSDHFIIQTNNGTSSGKSSGKWTSHAIFKYLREAESYARALASSNPRAYIRVVTPD